MLVAQSPGSTAERTDCWDSIENVGDTLNRLRTEVLIAASIPRSPRERGRDGCKTTEWYCPLSVRQLLSQEFVHRDPELQSHDTGTSPDLSSKGFCEHERAERPFARELEVLAEESLSPRRLVERRE